MLYDLCIIGGGPAAVGAGVYSARKQLKTIFIAKEFGGQSIVSEEVQNWIGTPKISGPDLAHTLEKHLREYAKDIIDIHVGEEVKKIEKKDDNFSVTTDTQTFKTKTVLIATGSSRRKLGIKGSDIFENKGITYCASCDGPLFSGQDVVVIGGGNAAFETCAQLLAYTKSVTLLVRSEKFRADEVTVNKILSHPNMKVIKNAVPTEVLGDKFVSEIVYEDAITKEKHTIATTGIFVEIGAMPATGFAKDLVNLNQYGAIVIDPRNQRTSVDGVWAAGDCTDGLYHQNNIATGDAVKALEDLYLWLKMK